jgi:nitrite reductase/ring-hydroxylating ferredoxin subunit
MFNMPVVEWVAVDVVADAVQDEIHGGRVGDRDVALVRTGSRWYAFRDWCSHAECAFTDYGELDGTIVICTCHGAEFDLRDGSVLQDPATEPIEVLPVRCRDGQVEVGIVPPGGESTP